LNSLVAFLLEHSKFLFAVSTLVRHIWSWFFPIHLLLHGWAFYGSTTALPIALLTLTPTALQAQLQQRVAALGTAGRKRLVPALAVQATALAMALAKVLAAVPVARVALVAHGAALLLCRGWMVGWGWLMKV